MEISERYSSLADNLKSEISESFTIYDANIMLNKMYFKDDHLKLKDFVFDKMSSTDFYRCFDSELSCYEHCC